MIFSPDLLPKVLDGTKTQTRRPYRKPRQFTMGRTYAVQPKRGEKAVARIHVENAFCQALGSISERDARAEGFANTAEFLEKWRSIYGKADLEQMVWALTFRLVEE